MNELYIKSIIIVLMIHWVADFILQSNWQAQNKSSNNYTLLSHVAVYTLVMTVIGFKFAIVNGLTHLVIDWFTSRWSKALWLKKEVHYFFVVIGFDQFLHASILIWTYFHLVD